MAFIILISVFTAAFFLVQALYVLRTGQTVLFLANAKHRHPPVAWLWRLGYAAVYLFPSVFVILMLAAFLRRSGLSRLSEWTSANSGMLFYATLLGAIGLAHLLEPAGMLRWTLRHNPELAGNKAALLTARLVGLVMLLMALFMLARL